MGKICVVFVAGGAGLSVRIADASSPPATRSVVEVVLSEDGFCCCGIAAGFLPESAAEVGNSNVLESEGLSESI